jgi:hypothetical protein
MSAGGVGVDRGLELVDQRNGRGGLLGVEGMHASAGFLRGERGYMVHVVPPGSR